MTTSSQDTAGGRTTRFARVRQSAAHAFRRDVLLLAALLAFGAIGFEHAYHSFLGVTEEHDAGGHLGHAVRDAVLAYPIALAAVAAGLRLARRFGPVARAGFVSVAFGILLVPSVRLHEVIDHALEGENAFAPHHEEHGLEAATGFWGSMLHGVRDAAVGEIAAVPLMVFGLLLLERSTRDRRARPWGRAIVVAATVAVTAFALGGVGFASDSGGSQARPAADHTFQLTDNPGNWFDSGVDIAGTRSLVIARPGDTVRFEVGSMSNTVHTATSL